MHERTVLGKESRGMQNTLRSSKCVRVHDILVGNRMQHFFLDFFVSLFQTSHFCAVFCPLMLVKWPSHLFLFSIPGGLFACLTPLLVSVFVSLYLWLSLVCSLSAASRRQRTTMRWGLRYAAGWGFMAQFAASHSESVEPPPPSPPPKHKACLRFVPKMTQSPSAYTTCHSFAQDALRPAGLIVLAHSFCWPPFVDRYISFL